MGSLVERFGYIDSGRTYVIADPREAWLVAVVRGRRWVAQRVPDDRVVIQPNVYVIGEVDLADRENFRASPDLVSYAVSRGWFDPAAGAKFNFRIVYQTPKRTAPDPRQFRGQELATGRAMSWPPAAPLPFAVTAGRSSRWPAWWPFCVTTRGSCRCSSGLPRSRPCSSFGPGCRPTSAASIGARPAGPT